MSRAGSLLGWVCAVAATMVAATACTANGTPLPREAQMHSWHTDIVATTFWVGEILDPDAIDGSQMISAFDARWYENYGGCDGIITLGVCWTEPRTAENDYFPTAMQPLQNPFYLDLPFDDVNNDAAFAQRDSVVPWADEYAEHSGDRGFSYMKNRWVELRNGDRRCYGQIQDAGPGKYDDAAYVFGTGNERPANKRFNGAGLDVSPALNGCLGFTQLNGKSDTVDWRFVDEADVPPGPWTRIVTTSPVVPFER